MNIVVGKEKQFQKSINNKIMINKLKNVILILCQTK